MNDNKWHRDDFEFISENVDYFPILDIGKASNKKEEYGFTIGPVCCA